VVSVVQLIDDFKQWPNEDLTEMGERGVNLSGGQKQVRVGASVFFYYFFLVSVFGFSFLGFSFSFVSLWFGFV
jgi:hypothetical protein